MKLTPRQTEILHLIQSHLLSFGAPPTRAEIAKTMGFKSPNAAEDHLRALARKGAIELMAGTSRGIRLIKTAHTPMAAPLNLFDHAIDFILEIPDMHLQDHGISKGDKLAFSRRLKAQTGQLVALQTAQGLEVSVLGQADTDIVGLALGLIRPFAVL